MLEICKIVAYLFRVTVSVIGTAFSITDVALNLNPLMGTGNIE